MERPEIAETHIPEFNEENPGYDLTPSAMGKMDEMEVDNNTGSHGDELLQEYNLLRARMQPLEYLGKELITFIKAWERWKMMKNYIDFTDMIAFTLLAKKPAPGNPKIGIFDEVQDFNKLELTLIRHWCQFQETTILAGDDDQAIYEFCGATPDAFLKPEIGPENKRVLQQSWRLPRLIQEYATTWIKQIKNRELKEYKPRNCEGEIIRMLDATYRAPQYLIGKAEEYAAQGKSVMILTTCGYMLEKIKKELRQNALPFHNPYRRTRGDWNPLGHFNVHRDSDILDHRVRYSTRDRLLAFFSPGTTIDGKNYWTVKDLALWSEIVKSRGVFKRGGKEKIDIAAEGFCDPIVSVPEWYKSIFEDFALENALARNIAWLKENLLGTKTKVADFPLQIIRRRGVDALREVPKIIISTIHGVKGGEADVVFLMPDLSYSAFEQYQRSGIGRESVIRTMYVGMTRARESLILCQPSGDFTARLN